MKISELGVGSKAEEIFASEGIETLFPPQEQAVNAGIMDGKSTVVCTPTASGKTVIAELASLSAVKKGGQVVYLVPLRALASEKYKDFSKWEKMGFSVSLQMGDLDSKFLPQKNTADILIATAEKCDSILRSRPNWFRDVKLLVIDEIHLIGTNRGPTYEILISKFKKMFNGVQILGLSATIGNADDLGTWLDAQVVRSIWRPVELKQRLVQGSANVMFSEAKKTADLGAQSLVFVNSRRSAEAVCDKFAEKFKKTLSDSDKEELKKISDEILDVLSPSTTQCKRLANAVLGGAAFHHAGIVNRQRELVEDAFKAGKIKVITATPSLAAGVNLPARKVIIRDIKRYTGHGLDYIPVLEYMQMAGRCVDGDTLVFKDDGTPITISEITSKYFAGNETGEKRVKEGMKILSIDMDTHKVVPSVLTHAWKRKVNKTIQIKTRGGKKIITTGDHPFLTFEKGLSGKPRTTKGNKDKLYEKAFELKKTYGYGPDRIAKIFKLPSSRMIQHWFYDNSVPARNSLSWRNANKLKKGKTFAETDYIASAVEFHTKEKIPGPATFLPMNKLVKKGNRYMTRVGHQSCKFPSKWSIDLCRFIAKIMSDGNIYYNKEDNSHQIRYYSKNKNVQDEYSKICLKLFGKSPTPLWRRGSYGSTFKSFVVGSFLENIGVPNGKKSLILRVPRIIFRMPKNHIKAFVLEYSKCDGYETPGSYVLVTCSEKLAYDFSLLLSKIGLVSRLYKKGPNSFRDRTGWEISVTKSQFDENKKLCSIGQLHPDMIKEIKQIREPSYVYDITLDKHHNFIANGLVIHNSGRPKYDKEGESVLLAATEYDMQYLKENYINGEPEDIHSQLGIEPILRMHVLASIASGFTRSKENLYDFFGSTFFAYEYGVDGEFKVKIERIIRQLEDWGFIKSKGGDKKDSLFVSAADLAPRPGAQNGRLLATPLGARVAELYLDPETARDFVLTFEDPKKIEKLEKNADTRALGLLELFCATTELRPLLKVKKKEEDEIWGLYYEQKDKLLTDDSDSDYLDRFKTSMMFFDWINERSEEFLLETYGIAPGLLRMKLASCEWVAYSCAELIPYMKSKRSLAKELSQLQMRIKHGIKEELLSLVAIKGIGRVRARTLFNAGIKTKEQIKKADKTKLESLLGKKVAENIMKQI